MVVFPETLMARDVRRFAARFCCKLLDQSSNGGDDACLKLGQPTAPIFPFA